MLSRYSKQLFLWNFVFKSFVENSYANKIENGRLGVILGLEITSDS